MNGASEAEGVGGGEVAGVGVGVVRRKEVCETWPGWRTERDRGPTLMRRRVEDALLAARRRRGHDGLLGKCNAKAGEWQKWPRYCCSRGRNCCGSAYVRIPAMHVAGVIGRASSTTPPHPAMVN